ncbi:MAG: nicotinate-nucleotide adenylyltransferase [Actinobacteria bacterium]|nr:nicotinate-nucleotide adenylyltransferase [Actinomycetota bacterium]MBV9666377.1 nicotinate-nucleotide adenylyltransferase [Actinomycetota bacterium]MBV9933482.1 nicotinate-nucleotide adenylyltransferase [Actinomycetota bacterium]
MKLGVLGGTFDPVHIGHLVAAVNARHTLDLDQVLLVVANVPWQKAGARVITPAPDRLAMVRAAVDDVDGLEASDLEIARGGESYTVDTLAELQRIHPGAELYLIVGADLVAELDTWERSDELRELATLAVVNRPGATVSASDGQDRGWRTANISIPMIDVSSTELRARVADGRPLDFLVPAGALRLIRQRGLYAGAR